MIFFRSALIVYFLLLPFQFALAPMEGVDLAVIRLVTVGLVLLWGMHGLLTRTVRFPSMLALFLFSGFIVVALGSALWAENASYALRKTLFLFSIVPIFVVLASVFYDRPAWRAVLLQAFVLGATISALVGIAIFCSQFVFGVVPVMAFLLQDILPFFLGPTFAQSVATHPSLLVNIAGATVLRASGVFPDPHMFSLYLALAWPFALRLAFQQVTVKNRWLWIGVTSILLAGVLLAFSRSAYVAVMVGMLVILLGSGILRKEYVRQHWASVLGGVLMCILLVLSPFGTRLYSSFSQEDGSNRERLRLWQEAIVHVREQPLLGVGLGNYPLTVKPSATYRDPIYAHNLFLDMAVELGLVGVGFFLSLVALSWFWALKRFQETRHWQALSLLASWSIFLVHALFEAPLFSVHILPIIMLFLAVGISYSYDKNPSS